MILSFSIHPPVYDVSVFVVFCSVPYFTILPTPKILPSISWNQNTKTIWFPILHLTLILWLSFFISELNPFPVRVFTQNIESFPFLFIPNNRIRKKKYWSDDEQVFHRVSNWLGLKNFWLSLLWGNFQERLDFTGRVSDCEELVGLLLRILCEWHF